MKLYDIPIEAADIEAELAENYGELTPEIEQRIAQFLSDGKDKIEAAAVVVKSLEADAAICKQEAQRLMQRAQYLDKGAEFYESRYREQQIRFVIKRAHQLGRQVLQPEDKCA